MIRNILSIVFGVLVGLAASPFVTAGLHYGSPFFVYFMSAFVGVAAMIGFGAVWWSIVRYGHERVLGLAIEIVLLTMVALTCLALGGTQRWSWVVIEALAAFAVMLWALRMVFDRKIMWVKTPLNVLVLLLVLYVFAQLLPVPASLTKIFQPATVRAHALGTANPPAQFAGAAGSGVISLNRAQTRDHLLLLMAYAAFFFVFINNVTRRVQVGRLLAVVLLSAFIASVAGFATDKQDERLLYRKWTMQGPFDRSPILNSEANREFSAGYGFDFATQEGDTVDFYVPKAHTGDVFGGFPSSNSAATVLAMGLVLAVGAFFAYTATWRGGWGTSGGLWMTREGSFVLALAFLAVATAAGLFMTKSRAGLGVAAALVPLVLIWVGFSRSRLAGILTVVGITAVIVLAVVVLNAGPVKQVVTDPVRAFLNPFEEDVRLEARRSAWGIIGDFPLFGTGLGTFGDAYPAYKVRGPMLYFAHCDVLQWWAETGLVGLALAGGILGVVVWTVVTGYRKLKDLFFRRLLIAVSLAAAAFLAHGLVDFPMAIPGVTILFVALVSAAMVIARDQISRHEENDFIF